VACAFVSSDFDGVVLNLDFDFFFLESWDFCGEEEVFSSVFQVYHGHFRWELTHHGESLEQSFRRPEEVFKVSSESVEGPVEFPSEARRSVRGYR